MTRLLARIGPFLCTRRLDMTSRGLVKLPWSWWRVLSSGACTSKLGSSAVLTLVTASSSLAATASCCSTKPSTATFAVASCIVIFLAAGKFPGTAYSILNAFIPSRTPRARRNVFSSAADVPRLLGVCYAPSATAVVCSSRAAASCTAERRGRGARRGWRRPLVLLLLLGGPRSKMQSSVAARAKASGSSHYACARWPCVSQHTCRRSRRGLQR